MDGPPGADVMTKEVDEAMVMEASKLEYAYQGVLDDVTQGEIRGVDTKNNATGIAKANFENGQYTMTATFENLPDPTGKDFYEGWVVRKSPFKFISTGKIEKVDGVYTNVYVSGDDLTNFSIVPFNYMIGRRRISIIRLKCQDIS